MAEPEAFFLIPLPGGRVARVPEEVLESYVAQGARAGHHPEQTGENVTAHSMSVEPTTGASVWHTEWELGPCNYTDESGFPQAAYTWHRHPLGTEYTEIYQA